VTLTRRQRYAAGAYRRFKHWLVRPVVDEIGRLLYGNDAGFVYNVRSRHHLRRLRASLTVLPRAPGGGSAAQRLTDDGYVKLDAPYSPALIAAIQAKFDAAVSDDHRSFATADEGASRRVVEPTETIPELRDLLTDGIQEILLAYYRTYFRVTEVAAWRNCHVKDLVPGTDVFSNLWHCDEYYPYRAKLFVNLTDVTPASGAFRLHSIRSTRDIMRAGFINRVVMLPRARQMLEDQTRVVYANGPAGSAILCNTNLCAHRAGVPGPGMHRDIVEFKFEPAAAPLPRDWYTRLEIDRDIPAHLRMTR
jgi:hypothetical protein